MAGHIQKRERDGTVSYRARITGPDRRERSKTFRRKIDAQRWLTDQQAAIDTGAWIDPAAGQTTVKEWSQVWMAARQVRPSTRARDESYLRNHVLPRFGSTPLSAISQPEVVAWVGELTGKGLAPATVAKAVQLLGAMMDAAADAGKIRRSPVHRVPLPEVHRHEMRFLDHGEVARLAAAIIPRYRVLVLVLAYGGLRIGEAAAHRPEQRVDTRREIDVQQTVAWVKGHPLLGPPKSRAGRRRVALPEPVWDELVAHIDTYSTEWTFPSPEGGILQPTNWRRRVWDPAVKEAGLAPLRPHDLRHTAVAMWIEAGADIKRVATRAGHTSVAFSLDRYGHLYPDADTALADRLGQAMSEAAEAARSADNVVAIASGRSE